MTTLALLDDAELDASIARAWREAVRAIADYRASAGHASAELREILAASANGCKPVLGRVAR